MFKQFTQNIFTGAGFFRKSLSVLLFVLAFSGLYAQTISGKVTNAKDGETLLGATVSEKGTTNGVVTDLDGNFSIKVSKLPATLVVANVGFNTTEVPVTDATSDLTISLQEGVLTDEVVVTALGMTREKKALPYSVQQIDGQKFQEVRTANVGNALTGKIAGVNVAALASGAAGSTRVVIRGGSS